MRSKSVRGLRDGDDQMGLSALSGDYQGELDKIRPLVDRAEKNTAAVMSQQKILTQVSAALRLINRQSSDLLEIAETVSSLKLQQNAPASEISAAGQLVMLTQRIGKSSNEFLTVEGVKAGAGLEVIDRAIQVHGGIGYSHDAGRSDMNNTLTALEALHYSKHLIADKGGDAKDRAIVAKSF